MRLFLTTALLLAGCNLATSDDDRFLDELESSLEAWSSESGMDDRLPSPIDSLMFSCIETLELVPGGAFQFDVHVEPGHRVGCAMGGDWRRFGPDISGRVGCEDPLTINLAGPRLIGLGEDDDADGIVQIAGTVPLGTTPTDSIYLQCVDLDACSTTYPLQLAELPTCDDVPDCPEYTLAIDEVMATNERSFVNPEGEYCPYFNLTNTGEYPVDLSGWTVTDGTHTATLEEDTTLEPGANLTQFTCGDPTASLVPSPLGGTLSLLDSDPFDGADLAPHRGCVAAEVSYPALGADQAFADGEVTDTPSPGDYLWLSELNLNPPEEGEHVRVQGVVTASKDTGVFIQGRGAEPYTGAWVYYGPDSEYSFVPGDFIEAGGLYDDYYGMTEINSFYGEILHFGTLETPEPVVISSADAGEPFEGMLVRVNDLTVTVSADSSGQFYVADGTMVDMPVDNGLFDDLALFSLTTVGTHYEFIQGILDYSWEEYELNPRDVDDFEITGGLPVLEPTPAEVPYLESFTGQNGRGVRGPDAEVGGDGWFMDDVSWSLEVDGAGLTSDEDYALVIEETMSIRDVDGLVTWSSPELPVSPGVAYLVSADVRGFGGLEVEDTFTATADGVVFANFADDSGDLPFPEDWTFSSLCLEPSGDTLQIVIQAINNSGSEYIEFDNVAVSEGCELPEPEPEPDLPYTAISDIQNGLVELETEVAVLGVVTALTSSGFFIQDDHVAWSGIYVYAPELVDPKSGTAAVGDYVHMEGTYTEYSELSELVDIEVYDVLSTGLVVDPVELDALPEPADLEMYEGVLVHVTTPMTVVDADLGYGEWLIADDFGQMMVLDDLVATDVDIEAPHCLGAPYLEVTGVMTYTYEAYKIAPLSTESIVTTPDVIDLSDCDEDGFAPIDGDCNDASNTTYPDAVEIPDGLDNDCDSEVDEDFADPGACYYTVFISEIADPNDNAGARYVELFNSGDTPFSLDGYYLARWTNSDFSPSTNTVPLDGLVVEPMSTVVICANVVDFNGAFPGSTCDFEGGDGGPVDSNGDDQIALANGPLDAGGIVDFFGVIGEDGSGTDHEFEDGQAMRSCPVTCASSEWGAADWDISNDGGAGAGAIDTTDGIFSPGSHCDGWVTPPTTTSTTGGTTTGGTTTGTTSTGTTSTGSTTSTGPTTPTTSTGTGTDTCSTEVFISEIADPNDDAGARYVELFNDSASDVALDGYGLRRWTNGNLEASFAEDVFLDGWVMGPSTTLIICADAADFESAFGVVCDLEGGTGGPVDSNGDDQIALIYGEDIVDFFGVIGEDGTGTDHEFEDGQAVRSCDVTCAESEWNASEWFVSNDGGVGFGALNTTDGVFSPGTHCGFGGTTTTSTSSSSSSTTTTTTSSSTGGTCSTTVYMSEIADPNNDTGARFVELFNDSAADVALDGFALRRWTNGNVTPSTSSDVALDGWIMGPGATLTVCANAADFFAAFGVDCDLEGGTGGPVDSNGDDQIALIFGEDIVDFFGVIGEDGSGTEHEFEDGQAERLCDITCAESEWSALDWFISNDGGAGYGAVDTDDGIFSPGAHCDG